MIKDLKIAVILPAYNAEKTLERTLADLDLNIVDEIIVVDDASKDGTSKLLENLPVSYATHAKNLGYGGNQKTCYALALDRGADVVVMLHPDYQYEPKLLGALAQLVASGVYDLAIASRILGKGALKGGMPLHKYIFNRMLTFTQNIMIGQKLSEYHTGYRAFSRKVLETLPLELNSDDFVFDNQMLVQAHHWGFNIGEISCPTKYFAEASSINFRRSCIYGLGVLKTSLDYLRAKFNLFTPAYLKQTESRPQGLLSLIRDPKRLVRMRYYQC
jgi:glycosyltransferase involved in cell wall biosynthesis